MSKKPKNKKPGILPIILIIVCIAIAAFAGYKLISIGFSYKQAENEYTALKQYTYEKSQTKEKSVSDDSTEETIKVPLDIDFDALKAINPDIVGWLYIDVEDISYPIVRADDNDYYLHRTFEKTENFAGSIFMECKNSGDFSDRNTILYGHNMKDGSMFGKLSSLYDFQDYLIDDSFWVITPDAAYRYKLFNLERTVSDGDVYTLFPEGAAGLKEYIEARVKESLVKFDIGEYDENSKIITLSTCVSSDGDGRFVVQGILEGVY